MHTLSPALPLSDRKEALQFVFDPKHLDILKESLSPGLEVNVISDVNSHELDPKVRYLCSFQSI